MYFSTGQDAQAIREPCGGVCQHCAGVCSSVPTHRVDAFVTLYTNRRSPPRHHVGASSDPAQQCFPSTTATRACRSRKQVRLLTLCGPSQTGVRRRQLASVDAAPCPWQLTLDRTCALLLLLQTSACCCASAARFDSRESRDADKKT